MPLRKTGVIGENTWQEHLMQVGQARVKFKTWWLFGFALVLSASPSARAQHVVGPEPQRPVKERALPGGYPSAPSLPPSYSVPVEPLGFAPPGALYLGERNSVASLDFIGEDRLLFTFRVPGLIHRQFKNGESEQSDERQIRAVVLKLPSGNVESEALWTVHDRARYLWMLNDGHFLLRDKENLFEGDASLTLKPLLQFPGPLLLIELDPDPDQQYIVSNSLEPSSAPGKPGTVESPATASATITTDGQSSDAQRQDYVVRILRRETGQVMLVSRSRAMVHLPINTEGYLESLRGRGDQWLLNLNLFTGGNRLLGAIQSNCVPNNIFVAQDEVAAVGCDNSGAVKLVAATVDGRTLWDVVNPATAVWPLVSGRAGGQLVSLETLAVTHPVTAYSPLSTDDIKGQLVRILDAGSGEIRFESPLSPILDAGGNVAVSPSGRRVAVINAGAIQVFDLPAPPKAAARQNR